MSRFLRGITCQNGEDCHGFCDAKTFLKSILHQTVLVFHTPCVKYWVGILILLWCPHTIFVGRFMTIACVFC